MEYLPPHIRQLLVNLTLDALEVSQEQTLLDWMEAHPEHQCLLDAARDKRRLSADLSALDRAGSGHWEDSYKAFESRYLSESHTKKRFTIGRWQWAAASVFILIMAGIWTIRYYSGFKSVPDASIVAARPLAEVLLANGQKFQLGGQTPSQFTPADGSQGDPLAATSAGQLVDTSWYNRLGLGAGLKENVEGTGADNAGTGIPLSFRIVTPKGGKYALALPDGSKVWMSAASSLSYSQDAGVRQVDMEGEIYFEVAKQPYLKNGKTLWRPFKVHAKDMDIEVWGTKFAVSSYPHSTTRTTTLFEGKVKISTADQSLFLAPGQRAVLTAGLLTMRLIDNSQGAPLKEGYFVFKAERLSDLLTEIGNWYNVDIVFEDDQIGQERFEAMLPRTSKLADLLGAIQSTGKINFTFKNRTIYVDKKTK